MRKPRYQFLPKRDKEAVDFATERMLLSLLESGHVRVVNNIVGIIQDLKDVTGKVSEDHEKCLRLPMVLFETAVKTRSYAHAPGCR